jgi:hypothetical protein
MQLVFVERSFYQGHEKAVEVAFAAMIRMQRYGAWVSLGDGSRITSESNCPRDAVFGVRASPELGAAHSELNYSIALCACESLKGRIQGNR